MNNKKFQTYFDYGSSKIRAGVFNKNNHNENFCEDSKTSKDYLNLDLVYYQEVMDGHYLIVT